VIKSRSFSRSAAFQMGGSSMPVREHRSLLTEHFAFNDDRVRHRFPQFLSNGWEELDQCYDSRTLCKI
jgi:hypothetical protein